MVDILLKKLLNRYMPENKKLKIIDTLLNYVPVLLSFLIPVWFLPITVEFFEFNKLTLLVTATVLMLILWAAKIAITRQVIIAKSKVDWGILAFSLVLILSTVFSVHKTTSIFGSTGRWYPGLFGVLALVVYYYITASNLTAANVKKIVFGLLAGATLSSLVSLLAYYNIFLGSASFLATPAFSLTGSTLTAMLLAIVAVVAALGLIPTTNNIIVKTSMVLATLINAYFVLAIHDYAFIGLLVVAVAILVMYTGVKRVKENVVHYSVAAAGLVLSAVILFVPLFTDITTNKNFPRPVTLPVGQSWLIASSTIREMPLLGSGPSTFYLKFPQFRTLGMNYTDFWTFRFDKPFNEFFNILTTMGILGFLAYGLFSVKVVKLGWDTLDKEESNFLAIAQTSMVVMVLANLVTYSTVVSDFLLFTFIAAVVAIKANVGQNNSYEDQSVASLTNWTQVAGGRNAAKQEYLHLIAITPVLGLAAVGAFLNYKAYAGEFYMRSALNKAVSNDATSAYNFMVKAIQENPQMESYHNTFAQTNLALANALAGKQNLSDSEKQSVQQLIAQAIRSATVSTERVNPASVGAWEVRGGIYKSIMAIAKDANDFAINSYTQAIRLDGTNPLLRLQLGGVYYANGKYLEAANLFKNSVDLKNDYANGWYNLAQALVQLKDYKNAQVALETVQKLVPADSQDAQKVAQELDDVKAKAAAAPATTADTKPTVDQLTAPTAPTTTQQQPLTNPSQTTEQVKTQTTTPANN